MKKYEYEITTHPSEEFKQVGFFCTDQGECNIDQLPADQLTVMGKILNERGTQGWELIQLDFGMGGIIAFWKREV
jgi:hypothetical protein